MAHPIVVEMTSPNNVLDSRPHYDSKKGDGTYNRAESSSLQPTTYTYINKEGNPQMEGVQKNMRERERERE